MMGFATYLGIRLVRLILSLIAVSVITFGLLQLAPGNFADISRVTSGATSIGGTGTESMLAETQARYGSDIPVWQQYLTFMKGLVTWDMGPSYRYAGRA